MINFDRTELFSSGERALLEEDMGLLNHVIKWGRLLVPLLLIITFCSWYFDWHSFFKFLGTALSVMGVIALAGAFAQVKNIRADLKANVKTITRFVVEEKIVEGDVSSNRHDGGGINGQKVKKRITISDEELQEALNYKKGKETATKSFPFNSGIDAYDKRLKYTFTLKVKTGEQKTSEDLKVSLEQYLVATKGETIDMSYGKRSKKVFAVVKK